MSTALRLALVAGLFSAAPALAQDSFERDRQAILGMAGHFDVRFRFEESVARQPGYELEERYDETAREYVTVVEDAGDLIRLQHILVVDHDSDEPFIVKHWRQDWTFEDTDWTVFRGRDTWERITVAPERVKGTWTQAVFQTGDAPRYESSGRWEHLAHGSAWTSGTTWRPLPRRERKRDDYDVVRGVNRHVVTPDGWVHEQDNQKLALDDEGNPASIVVHELGLNTYTRVPAEGLELAHEYWEGTRPFWGEVRAVWAEALPEPGLYRISGTKTIRSLSSLADDYLLGEAAQGADRDSRLRELILGSVEVAGRPVEAAAPQESGS